jgi:hypothetical protein
MNRLLAAAALLLLLAGCGTAFVYRQLDWLVPNYVGGYLPLEDGQRQLLDAHVRDLLAWHCGNQLDQYAGWLRTVDGDAQAGRLDRDRLGAHARQLDAYWRELGRQASPRLADLLSRAGEEEVRALLENLRDKERDFREDFVDAPAAKVERRLAERMEKSLRRWVGRLSDEQRQAVAAWSRPLAREQAVSLAMRARWREAAARALAMRGDPRRFPRLVEQLLVHPEQAWTEAQRDRFEARRARTLGLLETLAGSLTERQRRHLAEATAAWAADFERLACGPDRPGARAVAGGSG